LNYNFKELLAHLGHYNQSMKLDAVNSLKQMIIQNDDLIRFEFGNLFENLCPLFYDRDYKVREAVMLLFKTLIQLPYFSQNQSVLKPFYYLINVHLSCAMTNVIDTVQDSSLKILDILIENLPEFVQTHAYNIFENFIDQISKNNLKGDKRTLKNDPYKLTSTQEWRHKVLNRLHRMLLIVSSNKSESVASNEPSNHTNLDVELNRFDQFSVTETHFKQPGPLKIS
jgi:hypothetical protein